MKFKELSISGLWLIEPEPFQDAREKLTRHYCQKEFEPLGIDSRIRQTNLSENFKKHTLRGVHYQGVPTQDAKTMSCLIGAIHNITVDLRPTSPTFLQWETVELNDRANLSLHVPAGCAIGYLTYRFFGGDKQSFLVRDCNNETVNVIPCPCRIIVQILACCTEG